MIRTLLLSGAAIAAYALTQSHALLPLLSLLALLSLWVVSEIGSFFARFLPPYWMSRSITTTSKRPKSLDKRLARHWFHTVLISEISGL
ncbi:hypothetical protein [Aeromonas sp. QDB62]|uniref:hypothetical protein n=1 Tax=Aeromonas sp. QDB62 TaxID=2990499 RepID=UPI0022E5C342|nr:hypothetical protein [Aeromonas sp. QDB62]